MYSSITIYIILKIQYLKVLSKFFSTMLIRNGKSTNVQLNSTSFSNLDCFPYPILLLNFKHFASLSISYYFQDSVIVIYQMIFIIIRRNTIFLLRITKNLEAITVQRIYVSLRKHAYAIYCNISQL